MSLRILTMGLLSTALLVGCSSSKIKERKELREKVSQSSKLYCEFINGEMYPDTDVALNLEMAKHCDSEKPFSITNYKTPAENPGIMYCCSMMSKGPAPTAVFRNEAKKAEKKEEKKDDKKDDKAAETIE